MTEGDSCTTTNPVVCLDNHLHVPAQRYVWPGVFLKQNILSNFPNGLCFVVNTQTLIGQRVPGSSGCRGASHCSFSTVLDRLRTLTHWLPGFPRLTGTAGHLSMLPTQRVHAPRHLLVVRPQAPPKRVILKCVVLVHLSAARSILCVMSQSVQSGALIISNRGR